MAAAFATAAALPGRAPARRGVAAAAVRPARGLAAARSTRRCRPSVLRMAEEGAAPETDATAEVVKDAPPKKEKKVGGNKSLLKPDGTPYAPWMGGIVEEEGPRKVKKPKTDAKGRLANDPQAGELAGVGLNGRLLGDEVDLRWETGTEENNKGFKVTRRAGKSDKWEFVADYRTTPSELLTKGPDGGAYAFIDSTNPPPGTWIYRVSDVAKDGTINDLAQCMVEVESSNARSTQTIALTVLVILAIGLVVAGLVLDPQ